MKNLNEFFEAIKERTHEDIMVMLDEYLTSIRKKYGEGADLVYKESIRNLDNLNEWTKYHFNKSKTSVGRSNVGRTDDELLKLEEVSRILKQDIMTVRSHIVKGLLKSITIKEPGKRGSIRVRRSELEKFLNG